MMYVYINEVGYPNLGGNQIERKSEEIKISA